ncbi:hypothetical protein BH10PSE2_BH10PSE2_19470 [soil metagenome]
MAKLKVFTWSDGFHAFTVATTSRPKALQAWGISANIFASGLASQITTGPDHDAALASPGEVIQRGQAIDLGKISKAPKAEPKPAKPEPAKPDPDATDRARRDAVAAAQAERKALKADLAALDARQAEERADLHARRAALDAEETALAAEHRKARRQIADAIKAAEKTL